MAGGSEEAIYPCRQRWQACPGPTLPPVAHRLSQGCKAWTQESKKAKVAFMSEVMLLCCF